MLAFLKWKWADISTHDLKFDQRKVWPKKSLTNVSPLLMFGCANKDPQNSITNYISKNNDNQIYIC